MAKLATGSMRVNPFMPMQSVHGKRHLELGWFLKYLGIKALICKIFEGELTFDKYVVYDDSLKTKDQVPELTNSCSQLPWKVLSGTLMVFKIT